MISNMSTPFFVVFFLFVCFCLFGLVFFFMFPCLSSEYGIMTAENTLDKQVLNAFLFFLFFPPWT